MYQFHKDGGNKKQCKPMDQFILQRQPLQNCISVQVKNSRDLRCFKKVTKKCTGQLKQKLLAVFIPFNGSSRNFHTSHNFKC